MISFIVSGFKLWNDLPPENRNLEYAMEMSNEKSNDLFNFGPRDLNIRHAYELQQIKLASILASCS